MLPLEVPEKKSAISITEAVARLNIWEGSVRSSKSVSADIAWLIFVATCGPGPLLMVGKTRDTVQRNVIAPISEWMLEEDFKVQQNEVRIFGRKVYVIGANDEKAIKKIQGITLKGAYGDEVATWPESAFKMLLSRLSLPGAQFFGTTNPDNPYHWLKVDVLDALKPPHLHQWHFELEDNPYLPPEFVESLKQEYKPGTLWYKRYILGLWVAAEGAVYDMWNPDTHVVDNPVDILPRHWYVGIDYGTTNPTCFLMIAIEGGKAYCAREYYWDSVKKNKQKTDSEYADALKEWIGDTKIQMVILDPSAASFKVELQKRGYVVKDADNSVLDGIRTTARLLTAGNLHVHRSCENLIKEFSSYVWDERSQISGEDRPLKANDHACDALRYACQTMMGKGEARVLSFAGVR